MHIGLTISDITLARPVDTSLVLALEAARQGHRVSVFGIGGLAIGETGVLSARAVAVRPPVPATTHELHARLTDPSEPAVWTDVCDLDLLLLRADPNEGPGARTWSQPASIRLGQRAADLGVDVVNDPAGLMLAFDKMYTSRLPPELLPRTLLSRDVDLLRAFVDDLGGRAIVKPVSGTGGRRVFRIDHPRDPNLSQLIDLAAEDGYVMVQEYIAAAAESTLRIFLVGGAPLVVGGRHAALRHCPGPHDHRSNIHAGGSVAPALLTDAEVYAAEIVAPLLARDGLDVAGLDLAGGKVLEVNVFSPGGMFGVERFEGPGFATALVEYLVARRTTRAG